jgi:endonuclease/exonuclease/phosphatase family metal-dependent hydrolase
MRLFLVLISIIFFPPLISAQSDPLRLMSFNIRLPNPGDGINYWDNRRSLVTSVVQFHRADLLGVQEAFRRQLDELVSDMPEYDWFGVCRTDGSIHPDPDNEFSAILYRKDRFERLDGNTFWLSETPDTVGSKGWDAALPRIVTWAKFRDKSNGNIFFHFNTHFDHMGERAREESAKLLLEKVKNIAGEKPVVITGDFNSTDTSAAYKTMTSNTVAYHFTDALLVSKQPHHGPMGTFSGSFTLPGVGENRIDFIFIHGHVIVNTHAIISDSWDGRLPSDHLPVLAEIVLKE